MTPSVAHLIWFGTELPWLHVLAVKTAAQRGGFDRVVFHHADDLSRTHWWKSLSETPGVRCERFDPVEYVTMCTHPDAHALGRLFSKLRQPAAKANLMRAAILFREGGAYLDTDTVTLRSFEPLLNANQVVCGEERIAFPGDLRWSHVGRYTTALVRTSMRDGIRRLPDGWRFFRRIEHLYPRAANNAVLVAPPQHAFIARMLEEMVSMPVQRQRMRYALGTALLQSMIERHGNEGVLVLPPRTFYPLGPEISEHWFRYTPAPVPHSVIGEDTYVIHWYASVRTSRVVSEACPQWVREHAGTQLFSAVVQPLLDETIEGRLPAPPVEMSAVGLVDAPS